MISTQQQLLLKQYQEKSFVSSILAEEACNYFSFIKNIINIPLIICNSAMVCINSSITDQELLKILNIILNSSTGLILSLISNFKIYEHITQYHQLQIKYTKLSHLIDSKLTNDIDNINTAFIQNVIDDYDAISESQEFPYPSAIKKRIKKQYDTKLSLPSSLSVDIVEIECKNECCVSVKV
jgi:hypothetical protein